MWLAISTWHQQHMFLQPGSSFLILGTLSPCPCQSGRVAVGTFVSCGRCAHSAVLQLATCATSELPAQNHIFTAESGVLQLLILLR